MFAVFVRPIVPRVINADAQLLTSPREKIGIKLIGMSLACRIPRCDPFTRNRILLRPVPPVNSGSQPARSRLPYAGNERRGRAHRFCSIDIVPNHVLASGDRSVLFRAPLVPSDQPFEKRMVG